MANKDYYAVIMAGGIGSRFWPVSTSEFPKQFHDMLGTGKTLLQTTFSRVAGIIPEENILVLTNQRYLSITLQQLPQITEDQVVLEPAMRNTAPCLLLAAMKIKKKNPNALMLVAPSDHWIEDEVAFHSDIQLCFDACQRNDYLMTLGIVPTFPNTGYGYIEAEANSASEILKVRQFREKPNYETAKRFLEQGNFLWNAGIFIWSVKSIVNAFEKYQPTMHALFAEGKPVYNTPEEARFIEQNYALAQNISIDYAIMEQADNVYIKKAAFDWNDLGTWGALHEELDKDDQDNAVVGAKPHLANSLGNMVFAPSGKLVVVEGLNDYIIVDKEEVLLIFPKEKEQDIKSLLATVKQTFGEKYT
jgi:mannose-1-phosphate guanylyltransferase